jgi:hypothetical protein
MKKTVQFLGAHPWPTPRDTVEFVFEFSYVDSALIAKPEEKSSTQRATIVAAISRRLHAIWTNRDPLMDIQKVLFEFAKRHLAEKLKECSLREKEEMLLSTTTQPSECPFESATIQMNIGESFEVETSEPPIMENLSYVQLATSIIETRDYINALSVSKEKLGARLLSLNSERDLLQLFKGAQTEEDFTYRISALNSMATAMNETPLKAQVGETKTHSINLLESYLKSLPEYDDAAVKVLRAINKLRQAYPIHSDTADGVIDAHRFFRLPYPIKDYDEAWRKILLSYSDALKRIFDAISRAERG